MAELVSIRREGSTVRIGLNRPAKHNALDLEMVDQLHRALDECAVEPSVLIFESTTPGIFAAGADIAELRERGAREALAGINARLFEKVAAHPWPSIAVVDGPAIGGGSELALACDFRVATSRAMFAQPELQLGILAGAGANWRLRQIVGLQVARRILLAGERLNAEQALTVGLVDALVGDDELSESLEKMVRRITKSSWQALELTKKALSLDGATTDYDLAAQAVLFESREKRQRMTEFLNRKSQRGEGK